MFAVLLSSCASNYELVDIERRITLGDQSTYQIFLKPSIDKESGEIFVPSTKEQAYVELDNMLPRSIKNSLILSAKMITEKDIKHRCFFNYRTKFIKSFTIVNNGEEYGSDLYWDMITTISDLWEEDRLQISEYELGSGAYLLNHKSRIMLLLENYTAKQLNSTYLLEYLQQLEQKVKADVSDPCGR